MPEDMSSWRHLASSASSRISSVKGYLSQRDFKGVIQSATAYRDVNNANEPFNDRKSWRAWAGQKIKTRMGQNSGVSREEVRLFPGWATRRYRKINSEHEAFEVDVFVSGFAYAYRPSRSQRAFLRLAKGFASLPKLTGDTHSSESGSLSPIHLSPSTETLLAQINLPPLPTEISDDYDIQALERQLRRATTTDSETSTDSQSSGSSRSSSIDLDRNSAPPTNTWTPPSEGRNPASALSAEVLCRLHKNLESRLQPFWSSVLPSRTIRLHFFAPPHKSPESPTADDKRIISDIEPLAIQDVCTTPDGSFQARLSVNWEDMCQHPAGLHIAFGDPLLEHDLLVVAELLTEPSTSPSSMSPRSPGAEEKGHHSPSDSQAFPTFGIFPVVSTSLRIPITHSPIRVISDIDDTVKLSNILSGARAVFHNVFVKDLHENIIPGMGEWYSGMWRRGVRFHYVSNGPFQLLPIVNEFLQISKLPSGSIKLRSYAGRSLFNGLLSAPATRKRAGVVDILDSFPDSRFFLIGDTGEQDLELYADLARERPSQILAVVVRDVETGDPIDDPTGSNPPAAMGALSRFNTEDSLLPKRTLTNALRGNRALSQASVSSARSNSSNNTDFTAVSPTAEPEAINAFGMTNSDVESTPRPMQSAAGVDPRSADADFSVEQPGPTRTFSLESSSSMSTNSTTSSRLSETDKKRHGLQARVHHARKKMPGHVPLRVFRNPGECVEVMEILNKEGV